MHHAELMFRNIFENKNSEIGNSDYLIEYKIRNQTYSKICSLQKDFSIRSLSFEMPQTTQAFHVYYNKICLELPLGENNIMHLNKPVYTAKRQKIGFPKHILSNYRRPV